MATTAMPAMCGLFSLPAGAQDVRPLDTLTWGIKQAIESPVYTINDLLVQRAKLIPNVSLFAYPASPKSPDDYIHYTARDLDRFADEAARTYMAKGIPSKGNARDQEVVAILAPTNLDYVTTIFALSRLGYSLLLLSNRLPTVAYISLLQKTNCHRIVNSSNFDKHVKLVQAEWTLESFAILEKPSYDLSRPSGPYFTRKFDGRHEASKTAFIIHSSGSTGLPKPIFQSHMAALTNYSSGLGYRAFLTLPLYHNHGMSCFFRAIYSGNEIAMFNGNIPMTSSNLIAAMEKLRPEGFHGVPYALKLLGESKRGITLLRACAVVMFGGSSCPDALGDRLVKAGVYLVSHYGATEIGQVMTSFRPATDTAWNYLRPIAGRGQYLEFNPCGTNVFELIILDGFPSKVVSNSDNPRNSFHTSDTWTPHPTIPNAWKYLGRLDDRITLVNGEKCLPIPFEQSVRGNALVQECWMFGIGRALPGIMIVPSEKAGALTHEEQFNRIWPSIEASNSRVEGFSQVLKEMTKILPIGTDYPATDKGTMIRAKTYQKFAAEIDSIYERFEQGEKCGKATRLALNIEQLERYLLDAFRVSLGIGELGVDTDLFSAGVDSLQAIALRSMIKRKIDLGSRDVGQNVIFEFPCVKSLAAHLYALRNGQDLVARDELATMVDLIEKYSNFPQHLPGFDTVNQECIILTGATGSLGAQILFQLAKNAAVGAIYCLVRASSAETATERVFSAISSEMISVMNRRKIICLPSDLSLPDLGLPAITFSTIRSTLTKVIHCAWAVNFNLGVSSFESQHIKGTYNLLSLCLSVSTSRPASFYFCSSISAAAGTPLPATIQETYIRDLSHAQNMGYARSKLVTENIVKAAAEKTGMVARVLRVGQIIGDITTGVWNPTEAIPLMMRSAMTLGALPELDECLSWLPSDLVAKAFVEISGLECYEKGIAASSDDSSIVYHIQNRQHFHWTNDLLPALRSAGLTFRSIPQREWVQLLRNSSPDPVRNPAIKLLEFFADKYDNDSLGRKELVFLTEKTAKMSPTIAKGYDVIGSGLVKKMIDVWLQKWSASS